MNYKPHSCRSGGPRDEITFDSEHRVFRQTRGRCIEQLSGGKLISVTRNPRREHALVDGVEHSAPRACFSIH